MCKQGVSSDKSQWRVTRVLSTNITQETIFLVLILLYYIMLYYIILHYIILYYTSVNPASIYRGCIDRAAETQTHACWVCSISQMVIRLFYNSKTNLQWKSLLYHHPVDPTQRVNTTLNTSVVSQPLSSRRLIQNPTATI